MDDGPQFQPVLESRGRQNLVDNLRSELVSRTTPECCKAELSVGVEKGFLENAPFRMEKLANEWEIEFGLPLLDQSHLKTAEVCPVCVYWDGSPNVQVVMFLPVAESKFSLNEALMCELKIFSGSAVFSVQGAVHGRAQVKLGLHVDNMSETNVSALRLEKWSGKLVV